MSLIINKQTKISALLKAYPDALDTIIALSADFKKLRNPLLRKLMASRTTIAMAARIGGCQPEDFFLALEPLGFRWQDSGDPPPKEEHGSDTVQALSPLPPLEWIRHDVRGILDSGEDPLRSIQMQIQALEPGQGLVIINRFEPIPLICIIEKQGFQSQVQTLGEDWVETYFFRSHDSEWKAPDLQNAPSYLKEGDEEWERIWEQYQGRIQTIDVRDLPMPQPMMTILESLERLPLDHALYVNHKKVPLYLLPELEEKGWACIIKVLSDKEVKLLIYFDKTPRP